MRTFTMAAALGAALGCLAAPGAAQEYGPEDKKALAELQKQAKARYGDLLRLKNAGKVGETQEGLVAAVKSEYEDDELDPDDEQSRTVGDLVKDENADRKKLYAIIARGTDTDADEVARQAMVRHFRQASPDHYVKVKGSWVLRKDVKLDAKGEATEKTEKEKKEGAEKENKGTERGTGKT